MTTASKSTYRRGSDPKGTSQGTSDCWLPKNKTSVFLKMLNEIFDIEGGQVIALRKYNLSSKTYDGLKNDRRLSATMGRKILSIYKKVKK